MITGESEATYLEHCELVLQQLPKGTQHMTMPRTGHLVVTEHPQMAADTILDFVRHAAA